MFGFSKSKPINTRAAAENQFDTDLKVFLTNARRAGVSDRHVAQTLGGIVAGIRHQAKAAQEQRNNNLGAMPPGIYSNGKRIG